MWTLFPICVAIYQTVAWEFLQHSLLGGDSNYPSLKAIWNPLGIWKTILTDYSPNTWTWHKGDWIKSYEFPAIFRKPRSTHRDTKLLLTEAGSSGTSSSKLCSCLKSTWCHLPHWKCVSHSLAFTLNKKVLGEFFS